MQSCTIWPNGVIQLWDPGTKKKKVLLVLWERSNESWGSSLIWLRSSASFSRIPASATVTSPVHTRTVPSAPSTYLCPFSLAFSHVLCQNICIFPQCLSFFPDLFFWQAILHILSHSLFLIFLCLINVFLCTSFSFPALLWCQERKQSTLVLLSSLLLIIEEVELFWHKHQKEKLIELSRQQYGQLHWEISSLGWSGK